MKTFPHFMFSDFFPDKRALYNFEKYGEAREAADNMVQVRCILYK
jgi:hypothetical protein